MGILGRSCFVQLAVMLLSISVCLLPPVAAFAQTSVPKGDAKSKRVPTKIEVVPSKPPPPEEEQSEDRVDGSVFFVYENGERERITKGDTASQAKLGPDGLLGWTFGKERYRDSIVNDTLRIQRGHKLLFQVKSSLVFIQEWSFISEGIAVKSRAAHGPAHIELFSLKDGKRLKLITKAYRTDEDKEFDPKWAEPFLD